MRHSIRLVVAGVDLLREKNIVGWLVADADLVREKNTAGWLADKSNEQSDTCRDEIWLPDFQLMLLKFTCSCAHLCTVPASLTKTADSHVPPERDYGDDFA